MLVSGGVLINFSLRFLWVAPRYGSNDPATYAGEMGIVEDEPVSWNPKKNGGGGAKNEH